MKTIFLLFIFTVILPFPFCLFRRKKYDIPMSKMLIIYFVFSFFGALGAVIGSINANGIISGIRLYGLIFFDTVVLIPVSLLLKIKASDMGDYISVPIMAVCSFSKIVCAINGCCSGFKIFSENGELIFKFPSQWFEMGIWAFMVIALLYMEKKQKATGLRWQLVIIWFALFRFLAEFLRKPSLLNNNNVIIGGLNVANVFCLFLIVLGSVVLYFSVRKKMDRRPTLLEFVKSYFGIVS